MIKETSTRVIVALASVVLMVWACGSNESPTPTGTSPAFSPSGDSSVGPMAQGTEMLQEDDESTDSMSEESVSEDSANEDSTSEDDTSEDSMSEDANEDSESQDESEVHGLLFATVPCSLPEGNCISLTIRNTLVVVTADTQVNNKPARDNNFPVEALGNLLEGSTGLPLQAKGETTENGFIARKITIKENFKANGTITTTPGCELTLLVGSPPISLCFALAEGVIAPSSGPARVYGTVLFNELSFPPGFTYAARKVNPLD